MRTWRLSLVAPSSGCRGFGSPGAASQNRPLMGCLPRSTSRRRRLRPTSWGLRSSLSSHSSRHWPCRSFEPRGGDAPAVLATAHAAVGPERATDRAARSGRVEARTGSRPLRAALLGRPTSGGCRRRRTGPGTVPPTRSDADQRGPRDDRTARGSRQPSRGPAPGARGAPRSAAGTRTPATKGTTRSRAGRRPSWVRAPEPVTDPPWWPGRPTRPPPWKPSTGYRERSGHSSGTPPGIGAAGS